MTLAANKARAAAIYEILEKCYPEAHCTLDYHAPFELLIMTMLAAQCTDARVNIVAPELFRKYPRPKDFLDASRSEIEEAIRSTGFYRNKAKNILGACKKIVEEHGGEPPRTMEALLELPGVGRKTANVLLGECFGAQGVIVDTHCSRLARRLGFTRAKEPRTIERALEKVWPPERWTMFSHYLVFHGRAICTARAPKCSVCALRALCPFPETKEGQKIGR